MPQACPGWRTAPGTTPPIDPVSYDSRRPCGVEIDDAEVVVAERGQCNEVVITDAPQHMPSAKKEFWQRLARVGCLRVHRWGVVVLA